MWKSVKQLVVDWALCLVIALGFGLITDLLGWHYFANSLQFYESLAQVNGTDSPFLDFVVWCYLPVAAIVYFSAFLVRRKRA